MNHDLRRRILRAETALPGALETLVERGEQYKQRLSSLARIHAFAVAGIALYGQPRIEEPLARAWARTLAYCKENDFLERLEYLSKYFAARESAEREGRSKEEVRKEWDAKQKADRSNEPLSEPIHQSWEDYEEASEGLLRIVPDAQKERLTEKRLTEIFRSAPIWLLSFTLTSIDAKLLDFGLPDLSAAPNLGRLGFEMPGDGLCFRWG
jgi:hypothetical protein